MFHSEDVAQCFARAYWGGKRIEDHYVKGVLSHSNERKGEKPEFNP